MVMILYKVKYSKIIYKLKKRIANSNLNKIRKYKIN